MRLSIATTSSGPQTVRKEPAFVPHSLPPYVGDVCKAVYSPPPAQQSALLADQLFFLLPPLLTTKRRDLPDGTNIPCRT